MGDSSDSEEFYDAEEFTPIKGSKRSSLCKSINITDSIDTEKNKSPSRHKEQVKEYHHMKAEEPAPSGSLEDDKTIITNVVQGRKKFQELRRCLQTEEEDEGVMPDPSGSVDQNYTLEHPFKIISHDTMSLQSMTSLGRIGRILSGASESQSNFRETMPLPSASSREPSTISDDPITADCRIIGTQNVLGTAEPDVIASTKANSLRGRAAPALATSAQLSPAAPPAPTKPPRRKKRNKLHGSQSLSTTDGDNLSVCTDTDLDDRIQEKPHLHSLIVDAPPASSAGSQFVALPSPASTIESLTREFQDSLELSQSKYASELSISVTESRHDPSRVRANTDTPERYGPKAEWAGPGSGRRREASVSTGGSGEDARRLHLTGHSSLGSTTRRSGAGGAGLGTAVGGVATAVGGTPAGAGAGRRRSAGDEAALGAAALRTRTVSGHTLSDREILDQVVVTNLDTGERVPLSVAETKLPQCINPLSLHIMRLTSEYIHNHDDNDDNTRETDEESESVCAGGTEDEAKDTKRESADRQATGIKRKTEKESLADLVKSHSQGNINVRLKRFFGTTVRKTVSAARSLAAEVSQARHKEDVADIADDVRGETNIKLKASNSHKGPYDFDNSVRHVQEMGSGHMGAVWCCKFSVCGQLLATAGQDKLLRVWVARDAAHMFQDMRTKYNANKKCSPSPSQESLGPTSPPAPSPSPPPGPAAPFLPTPFCTYSGHTSDLLDVSWSKNYFILSSSMDKTVRLWHISRGECLCCFQHIDFVTAIVFHPRDDRYFLSGSLDGKLRLWDIPDKKVAVWNEVDGKTKLITAANFCQNGKFAVVGTYDGRCIFYTTDQLKYHTQIDVRSTRGKNSTGRKISGIEPMPNDDKILVTSNDSRIRLYDLRDLNLSCKYKGYVNVSSQIKASFSHDGKYIVSGSENQCIYIWKTYHDYSKFTSVRRDRNDFWEGIKAHNAVVTCAVFAPNPDHMIRMIDEREEEHKMNLKGSEPECEPVKSPETSMVSSSQTGHVLVSADFNGCIKVFVHKAKPKHSSLPASALA